MEVGDKMIPKEICEKYNVADVSEYATESEFYIAFLSATNHIPNKIIESLVEKLTDATTLNFISVFIQFIKDAKVNYSDILSYRKFARAEINRLEGDREEVTA